MFFLFESSVSNFSGRQIGRTAKRQTLTWWIEFCGWCPYKQRKKLGAERKRRETQQKDVVNFRNLKKKIKILQLRNWNTFLFVKKTCYGKVELPSRIPGAILWWREVASGRVCKDTMYLMYHVVPPKDRKVPEGVDMLTFPKQMLEGLPRFTYMTRVTVSNFGLEKFVASVLDVIVYFKLQHRKLYVFRDFEWKNV